MSSWGNAMNETHWFAKWIGAPKDLQRKALINIRPADKEVISSHDGLKPVLYFTKRTTIELKNIFQVKLYITARGMYKVYYNKRTLSSGNGEPQFNPGWTDYNKTIQYQVYDVTKETDSENITIGALLGTGWYSGYVGMRKHHSYYGHDEYLLVELHIDYQNGTRTIVASDETWKVTTGPQLYSDLLHGELFYEDRKLNDWMELDYRNESEWYFVVTKPLNKSVKFTAETYQEITTIDLIEGIEAWELSPNVWVYDFGVNFVGYVTITLRNYTSNSVIQIRHAEMVYPNGTLYTMNLRSARATDTYVLDGK